MHSCCPPCTASAKTLPTSRISPSPVLSVRRPPVHGPYRPSSHAFLKVSSLHQSRYFNRFDDVTAAGPTGSTGRIDVLEVIGNVAVVRVILASYHGGDYVDYHALLKDENDWKIMAKVFTEA